MKKTSSISLLIILVFVCTVCSCNQQTSTPYHITPIPDNSSPKFMPTALFAQATDSMLQSLGVENGIPSSVCAILVETDGKQILFDTGNGVEDSQLMPTLKAKGIEANDIDYIFITHLHGDHIGGLTQNESAVFPNAQLYIPQAEYDGWMKMEETKTTKIRNLIHIYSNKITLFDDKTPLPHGISSIATYGHTPGHTIYQLGQNLIVGDIMHGVALQIANPEICARYDMDIEKAIESRKAVIKLAKDKGLVLYGMHFPEPYQLNFAK